MKNILYLHGLNSTLHDDRREALEEYGFNIFAPQLDYENDPTVLDKLLTEYKNIDFIIGSSAGGLVGYYLSGLLHVPALVFNPALPFVKDSMNLPDLSVRENFLLAVIGAKDEIVNPYKSFEILNNEKNSEDFIEIHWRKQMQHSLPINIFKEEIKYFFDKVLS